MDFQISGLDADQFSHLCGKDTEALASLGIERMVVDGKPGYPCRVSLQDAELGDTVLLLNFEHQPAATPYRSSHAIFVRESAPQAQLAANDIPAMLRRRLISVRAFDAAEMMTDADIVAGPELGAMIGSMLANDSVEYLHLHNAQRGCYLARVDRA